MSAKFQIQGSDFVISNYNQAAPFSSFFPALAGETGKPMWLFYTNRGQAVSSFGVNNKDGALLEFLPANKAYQATSLLGFRTFIRQGNQWFEPFALNSESIQTMTVRPFEIELSDKNSDAGVESTVVYFGLPNSSEPCLARSLSLKNTTKKPITLDVIDGLPRLMPFGMNDYLVKNISRTIEAFAEVRGLKSNVPFFKLKIEPSDRPEFVEIHSGFFSCGFLKNELVPVIVDPSKVFGEDTAFLKPSNQFNRNSAFKNQLTCNIMPSSFYSFPLTLKAGETVTYYSYYGYAETELNSINFAEKIELSSKFFDSKREENKRIYTELVSNFGFKTDDDRLNSYGEVTFMDNVLRGGLPVNIGGKGPVVHLYSRKHGDMERDYNAFQVSATYFSQGNGNFRDVNQNRRHDLILNPQVGPMNVEFFFNLLQIDGYNPLVINPLKFHVSREAFSKTELNMNHQSRGEFEALFQKPALIGQIYDFVKKYSLDPLNVNKIFLEIISQATPHQGIEFGEGYWIDHWIYNLDHIDQFLSYFPDKKQWLFFEKNDFTFYDSDHFVNPRKEKYVITKDGQLRQYNSVVLSKIKKELIEARVHEPNKLRTEEGRGEIFRTSFFVKLLALAAVKASSLDPYGMGIEMDANKPGWCDAMNGCPALFGSSTHELVALRKLVKLLLDVIIPHAPHKAIEIPHEIFHLLRNIEHALEVRTKKDFRVSWDMLATAKEAFREKAFFGLMGKMRPTRYMEIQRALEAILATIDEGLEKITDPETGLPTSYYTYEVNASELTDGWRQNLSKLDWKQHRVKNFLEGAVHITKVLPKPKAEKLYQSIRKSELYDNKVGMFKLNIPVDTESPEIGRARVFTKGWLENESIFLHMHYKYLLEILKSGMVDEFFKEIKTGWIPYQKPEIYGRSVFENSSFIASSAFPVESFHGRGFVARLSGATSEFLSMIYYLAFGPNPFKEVEGGIAFTPDPMFPKEWFTSKETTDLAANSLTIKLFKTPVTFVNPKKKNTYGKGAVKPRHFEWILDGRFHHEDGSTLPLDASLALREGRIESLTIELK